MQEVCELKIFTCVTNEPEGIVWFATNYTNRLPYCKKCLCTKQQQ